MLEPTKVATVGVGYLHGYPRSMGSRGLVAIDGIMAPVIGGVSMDLITIDVSSVPERFLYPGVPVELIGPNVRDLTPAGACGTIEHEIPISLGRGTRRTYIKCLIYTAERQCD